jgi:putative membrane protein
LWVRCRVLPPADLFGYMGGMEVEDATRRTHLANERTHLAWWRTGLTALAVGLAAGRIVPELAGGAAWPFQVLGAGYAVLGLSLILYGHQRRAEVERALARGEWSVFPANVALAMTGAGLVLGAGTIVAIIFAGG